MGCSWKKLNGKLFLVEAKSHIPELISTLQAKDDSSARKICRSLDDTKRYMNSGSKTDWSRGFYQYANRSAHLYVLRQNQLSAYLVFVYFINDDTVKGPAIVQEWEGAIKVVHSYLGIGRHRLQKFVVDLFIDVTHL